MNLVFLAPFAFSPKATVSSRLLPLAIALSERGHGVTILIPPYDNASDSGRNWRHKNVQVENMTLRAMPRLRWMVDPIQYALFAQGLANRTRQLHPDVIHVFKPVGPAALAMSLMHVRGERRFVVDNDDWEGPGGWLDVNPYPPLQKRVMAWQEVWSLRRARAITCASSVLRDRCQMLAGARQPIVVLPNGPAPELRDQVARAEQQRDALRMRFGWSVPVVIYAGTIPLNQDMDIAITAVRNALSRHTTLKWVVIATGDGLADFRAAVRRAGIDDVTEFHSFMHHDQLIERLVAADIAIYPYRDTNINRAKCSGKVIDYMVSAKACVLSDVGMNGVYIEHERSGLLTRPGDSASFSDALLRLLLEPTLARELGKRAQQRVWEQFSWDKRVGPLESLYSAIAPPASAGD